MGKANLKFTQSGMTGGDCTAPYNVSFSPGCTLRELISEILERGEWGYIEIKSPCYLPCEYRRDKIIESSSLIEEYQDKVVKRVVASGGYSRMDYLVYLI